MNIAISIIFAIGLVAFAIYEIISIINLVQERKKAKSQNDKEVK